MPEPVVVYPETKLPEAPPVRVVQIDLPFWSIVWLLLKWSLAAIPALLILAALWAFVLGVVMAIG